MSEHNPYADILSESLTNELLSHIDKFTRCLKQDNIITWNEADKIIESHNCVATSRNMITGRTVLDTKIIQIIYTIMLHLSQCNEAAMSHLRQLTDILLQRYPATKLHSEVVRTESCPGYGTV